MRSFLLLVLFASPCFAGDPVTASVKVDHIISRTPYQLVAGGGSGTVVAVESGNALVLTNKHVIERDCEAYVQVRGERFRAKFLGNDPYADIAALVITAPEKVDPCPPADSVVPKQVEVVQYGYPGKRFVNRRGWLWSRQRDCDHFVLRTSAGEDTTNGDSGSGIFADGRLVGIVWGGTPVDPRTGQQLLDQGQTVSSVVRLEDIRRFCATGERVRWFPNLAAKCR